MNHVEHYHDWLRDAHAMEKQAESMLESMAGRIDNYPICAAELNSTSPKPSAKLRFWKRFWIVMIYRGRC